MKHFRTKEYSTWYFAVPDLSVAHMALQNAMRRHAEKFEMVANGTDMALKLSFKREHNVVI